MADEEMELDELAENVGVSLPRKSQATPTRKSLSVKKKKTEKRKIKPATLKNALKHQHDRRQAGRVYSEDLPSKVDGAVDSSDSLNNKLAGVGEMNPGQRAEVGALVGAHLGNKVAGAHGSLMGAAIGSAATRSLGLAQSGEKELTERQSKVIEVLQTTKVIDENMQMSFSDGSSFDVSDPMSESLPNTSPNVVGKKARTIYQLDPTNPFSSRAQNVAKPLAYYIVGGLLGQSDFKDKNVLKVIDNTGTMFINAFENEVNDINAVYSRAKDVKKKLGCSEAQLKQFFYSVRKQLSAEDANDVKQGIELLFSE